MLLKKILLGLSLLLCFAHCEFAGAQTTKLVVAYASPAATFCPGWIAKKEGIFAKYGLDVEMVLMQGASVYMPALAAAISRCFTVAALPCLGPLPPSDSISR